MKATVISMGMVPMATKKVQPPQEAVVAILQKAHQQLAAETREEIARVEAKEAVRRKQ